MKLKKWGGVKIHRGIIIYSSLPSHNRLIFLNENGSKVDGYLDRKKKYPYGLVHGALVDYIYKQGTTTNLEAVDSLVAPVLGDIRFMHHVLEVIRVYLEPGIEIPAIFELVALLYYVVGDQANKKLVLCKLLLLLGIHPDEELYDASLFSLISCAEDSMFESQNDLVLETKLMKWLERSLCLVEGHDRLKTYSFIKSLEPAV